MRNYVPAVLAVAGAAQILAATQVIAADFGTDLDSVVVTATRTAEPADATLASLSVITRADINRLQPHSVAELLAGLPGVSVVNSGGLGKQTSVFLRGTDSDDVLVLIDGITVGSATSGTTAFEQIPVDQIERIEIVRGPRSSLYGSGAIGGVIQIFTRKGNGTVTPSLSVGGGSSDTWQGQAGLTGGDSHAWYSINVAGLYTGGFNACRGAGAPVFAGCFTDEPDKDGYWNTSGSVRGGYRLDNGAELSADFLHAYGNTHYDGEFQNISKVVQQVLGGAAKLPTIGIWRSSLSVGQSEDFSSNYENRAFAGFFNTRRSNASWQNDFAMTSQQQVTAGVDYLRDQVASDTQYAVRSRQDIGGFAQYQGDFGNTDALLSLRGDHDQQFGDHFTGGAALGYAVSDTLRITAAYGTAFKAPTFNDLYFPYFGNPDLKPVSSRSLEIGLAGRWAPWKWALNGYETRVGDLIAFDATIGGPANIARVLIRGLEGRIGVDWQDWRSELSVTLLDPRDRTPGDGNALLARRAQQTVRLDIDRQLGRCSLGATLFESGRRYDDLANTQPLGGYGTLDLRAGYQFDSWWLLQLHLSNLLDRNYETAAYYNQPGFGLFVTIRYQPLKT